MDGIDPASRSPSTRPTSRASAPSKRVSAERSPRLGDRATIVARRRARDASKAHCVLGSAPADGGHQAQISATDAAGNVTTATREVFIDGTPPRVDLRRPRNRKIIVGVTDTASGFAGGQIYVRQGSAQPYRALPTTYSRGAHACAARPREPQADRRARGGPRQRGERGQRGAGAVQDHERPDRQAQAQAAARAGARTVRTPGHVARPADLVGGAAAGRRPDQRVVDTARSWRRSDLGGLRHHRSDGPVRAHRPSRRRAATCCCPMRAWTTASPPSGGSGFAFPRRARSRRRASGWAGPEGCGSEAACATRAPGSSWSCKATRAAAGGRSPTRARAAAGSGGRATAFSGRPGRYPIRVRIRRQTGLPYETGHSQARHGARAAERQRTILTVTIRDAPPAYG